MSAYLDDLLKTGRKILEDTKTPKIVVKKGKETIGSPTETDPHKVFIRRTIQEKPKKTVVVEEIKRFITAAEALL
jgi:hypothetical protein